MDKNIRSYHLHGVRLDSFLNPSDRCWYTHYTYQSTQCNPPQHSNIKLYTHTQHCPRIYSAVMHTVLKSPLHLYIILHSHIHCAMLTPIYKHTQEFTLQLVSFVFKN